MRPAPIDPPEIAEQLWRGFNGALAWDIGANCGQSLPWALSRFAEVVAFEPATECLPWLRHWCLDNPVLAARVTIRTVALSDTDAPVTLSVLPDKIATGQLVTADVRGMEWDPQDRAGTRVVPGRTVDSLVAEYEKPPDFMKIDVEGHELKVLTGAWQTLTDFHPDLLIEWHSPQLYADCLECLSAHGYTRVSVVRHPHYRPGSPMWHQHGWITASTGDR